VERFFDAVGAQLEEARETEEAERGLVARAFRAAKRKVGLGKEEE
jgi:hypothetical protein